VNLILLFESDFIDTKRVRLAGRRYEHIAQILKPQLGDQLCVGQANARIGTGRVVAHNRQSVELQVELKHNPPKALPLTLIVALPRPQVIKRTLLCASSLGIKKIIFLDFARVEKTFWQSSTLREDAIQASLVLGLEQAKDTVLPEVLLRKDFKGFVQGELPALIKGTLPLLAHPGSSNPCPKGVRQTVSLVIGPEGGLTEGEVKAFSVLGFQMIDLGPRILRVESVLPFAAGRLF